MLKLFVDFDNTISLGDVGDALFMKFGGEACTRLDREYREGRLSAKECIRMKCRVCGTVDRGEVDAFLDKQGIDPTFPGFLQFCRTGGIDCTVVSDGFDYYLKSVLHRYGLDDLAYFSNGLTLEPVSVDGPVQLVPSFPYDDEECARCGCCKRNIMVTRAGEDDILVYVGDGYSDQCPVPYADVVFAKPELQAFCQRNNISYFEFRTFDDVRGRMDQFLHRKRLRKRQTAEANRRALLLAG